VAAARLEVAERVDEAGGQQAVEARALLVGEAGVAAVGAGVGQVDLPVRDVQVAAEDHRLALLEGAQVLQERRIPLLLAELQPGQLALHVGRVHRDHEHVVELGGEHPALGVQLGDAQARPHRPQRHARQDGGARVAWTQRGVPVHRPAGQVELDLRGQRADLLQADQVGAAAVQVIEKTLVQAGPQAVDVPRDQFHASSPPPAGAGVQVVLILCKAAAAGWIGRLRQPRLVGPPQPGRSA